MLVVIHIFMPGFGLYTGPFFNVVQMGNIGGIPEYTQKNRTG
jgi:hypothetical protein